jgi:hypothetical protein
MPPVAEFDPNDLAHRSDARTILSCFEGYQSPYHPLFYGFLEQINR